MISDAQIIITKNTFEVKRLWDGQCACREGMDPKKGGEGQKTVRRKGAIALSGRAWCARIVSENEMDVKGSEEKKVHEDAIRAAPDAA